MTGQGARTKTPSESRMWRWTGDFTVLLLSIVRCPCSPWDSPLRRGQAGGAYRSSVGTDHCPSVKSLDDAAHPPYLRTFELRIGLSHSAAGASDLDADLHKGMRNRWPKSTQLLVRSCHAATDVAGMADLETHAGLCFAGSPRGSVFGRSPPDRDRPEQALGLCGEASRI
jgi:hypothetical protein